MIELPYIRECLALNKSPLLTGNGDTTAQERKPESTITIMHSIPKDQGVTGVLSFMKANEADPDCQLSALKILLDMASEKQKMTDSAKRTVAELMRKHIAKLDLQIVACRLLAVLAAEGYYNSQYTISPRLESGSHSP